MTNRRPRTSCGGCSRRDVLYGIGIAAATTFVLGGCSDSGASLPAATATTCSGGTCIDLGNGDNSELTSVGGAMVVGIGRDTVAVIRSSETEVTALSDVCTHEGCTMDYDASASQLTCPCHGSVFSLSGTVLQGPARSPVKVYTASLASNVITISG